MSIDTKSRTTSRNLYYVAISRAVHEARIYTNSTKELPQAVSKLYAKTTALGVLQERDARQINARSKPLPAAGLQTPVPRCKAAGEGIQHGPW
jgi:hypothetical protein